MRILLADRQDLVRETMAAFLEATGLPQVMLCASMADVEAALEAKPYDLVVIDAGLSTRDELAAFLLKFPGLRLAVMTATASREQTNAVFRAGALGVIPKTLSARSMADGIRSMLRGESFDPVSPDGGASENAYALTRREIDVLHGLYAGKSNKEIGRDLDLQEVTVKLHVKTLSRKLGAKNRTHAAMIARDEGQV